MKTVPDIIEAFGGSTELARLLGAPIPTVGAWKHRNSIPPEYFPDIIRLAKGRGIKGVSFESLYAIRPDTLRRAKA